MSELLPCSTCNKHQLTTYNAMYILHNIHPLTDKFLTSSEALIQWIKEFKRLVQGSAEFPNISKIPKNFGRHWWYVIHSCSICDTVDKRMIYIEMIKCLVKLIPCSSCSKHATEFVFEKNPVELYGNSIEDLFYWTYLFHEYANDNTKVPKNKRPTFKQVCQLYLEN